MFSMLFFVTVCSSICQVVLKITKSSENRLHKRKLICTIETGFFP